ncbi:integral inner membrane protein [Lactobacillus selangorensis]|uniref:Integral inner membrane protein n=1 Tax=Lactobacillus selangorensis TaxID=81857 RepID=A0A0R2FFS4_9LACO|nr:CvpA family protein [Lactobacillus selangorensis]KRN27457.1 integral inner membrane protein [Lactobacillus selangorensis]KRN31346.1 integral inner membrane protein [Lactobacillus selangorensis]
MLDLLIIILLLYAIYAGARRGIALQLVYTIGYLLSFGLARLFFRQLGPSLELWIPYPSATLASDFTFFSSKVGLTLDKSFYAGIAFLMILFAGWLVTRFVAIFFHQLTYVPFKKHINHIGGGLLGFLVVYCGITLVLSLLAVIPITAIQSLLAHSFLAGLMIQHTPILSHQIWTWWLLK